MAFIQIFLVVNLISSAWGHAVYLNCNGGVSEFEGGCSGCDGGKLLERTTVMGGPVEMDESILVAPVKETKPSTTVVLTFVLDGMKAGIQATGGSFEETTATGGTVQTIGCDDDNILINWGGKAAPVTGTAEITWTAPSKPGFSVDFVAVTGTSYGATIKVTSFTISDSDGVATMAPEAPTAKTVDVASSTTDDDASSLSGDDSAAFRVEIPMAFMITLFIGLLKF